MKKERISTLGLYSYILGTAIGAGMFVTLPAAIGYTGKSVVLSVLIAGFAAFMGYFFTLVVSSFVPIKGGSYGAMAFNSPASLPGVYGMVTLVWCISNNTYAVGAIDYLSEALPFLKVNPKLSVVLLLALFIFIDYLGVNLGAKVQSFLTVTLVGSLLMFIIVGLFQADFSVLTDSSVPFFSNGMQGFSKSIGMSLWVVSGIGLNAVNFCQNVKKPTRTIPKAILIGNVFIITVGILLSIVCITNAPIDVASQGVNVVAKSVLPPVLFYLLVIGGAAFALLSSLQGYTLSYRISMIENAEDGFLPKFFLKKTKSGYPYIIGLTIFGLSVIPYVLNMDLSAVVSYCGAPVYILILLVNLNCASLPKKYPELWKRSMIHMPMPLWYSLIGLSCVASLYVIYCYCCDYSISQLITMAIVVTAMFGWAIFRVKSKYVNIEKYNQKREEIIRDSLAAAEEEAAEATEK